MDKIILKKHSFGLKSEGVQYVHADSCLIRLLTVNLAEEIFLFHPESNCD